MIKNCSREYNKTIIPISTEKYKDGDDIKEYVFDITLNIQSQTKVTKTTQFNDYVGNFVVKLRGMNTDNHFL